MFFSLAHKSELMKYIGGMKVNQLIDTKIYENIRIAVAEAAILYKILGQLN